MFSFRLFPVPIQKKILVPAPIRERLLIVNIFLKCHQRNTIELCRNAFLHFYKQWWISLRYRIYGLEVILCEIMQILLHFHTIWYKKLGLSKFTKFHIHAASLIVELQPQFC